MAFKYTKEQLNKLDKELLIQLFLGLQDQMDELTKQTQALNDKMQLMMEQIVLSNKNRFGRSSEKLAVPVSKSALWKWMVRSFSLMKQKLSVILMPLNQMIWNSGHQRRKSRQAKKLPICLDSLSTAFHRAIYCGNGCESYIQILFVHHF